MKAEAPAKAQAVHSSHMFCDGTLAVRASLPADRSDRDIGGSSVFSASVDPLPSSLDSITLQLLETYKARGSNAALQAARSMHLSLAESTDECVLWLDIYVKIGTDSQPVQKTIVQHGGYVKSFIGWYKGGAFAARLPLSALEAVASHDNILSVNAVIRPTTQHTRLRGDHVSRLLEKLNEAMAAVTGTSLNDQAYIPMGM
eukprot:CAMPEP_0184665834 /NCGR_PEP_ID=MMETSP0308-20130426/58860_1 /TAXON_ID=38269 /ORGANISM="Gloeochaete witrockiana, Strain SAG 46.84" /LENGTH=200 /DNA_ID=CAMNT_0027110077 /DNA_START=152 /DNA_END=752 /DNA_ORIENTATION=-